MSNATEIASDNSGGDEQTATVAVGALIIVLAIITVVLRFYTRITTRVGLGWDDWLILVAVVFTLLTAVLLVWGMLDFPYPKRALRKTICRASSSLLAQAIRSTRQEP